MKKKLDNATALYFLRTIKDYFVHAIIKTVKKPLNKKNISYFYSNLSVGIRVRNSASVWRAV